LKAGKILSKKQEFGTLRHEKTAFQREKNEMTSQRTKPAIDVGYVAELARIKLDPSAKEKLQTDMEAILGYIEQLNELDVSKIEPTAHAAPLTNIWREDVSGQSFPREKMLSNAPQTIDGELVKAPPVLPGEEMSS
jgi:aspartyl-tRNA(Asn)/glutamyl-tRNA(Gln) amidotransferase subunit C